ncbi:hypothetical protein EI94DRAFT_1819954 [Lactarius quietus]|nr:hypothetical protein EI94DRAFT_1819954 [Lactarius quietus]
MGPGARKQSQFPPATWRCALWASITRSKYRDVPPGVPSVRIHAPSDGVAPRYLFPPSLPRPRTSLYHHPTRQGRPLFLPFSSSSFHSPQHDRSWGPGPFDVISFTSSSDSPPPPPRPSARKIKKRRGQLMAHVLIPPLPSGGPGSTNAPGAGSSEKMEKMKKKADLAKEAVVVVDEEDEEVEQHPPTGEEARAGTFSDSGSTEVVIITSTKSVRETPPSAHPDDQFVQETKPDNSDEIVVDSQRHVPKTRRTSNRKPIPDILANSTARSPHPPPPAPPTSNRRPLLPTADPTEKRKKCKGKRSGRVFGVPDLLANLPAAAELAPVTYGGVCAIASDPSPSLQNSGYLDLNVSIGIADNPADAHLDGETCGADDADDAVPLTFSAFAARLLRYPLPPRRVHAQLQQDSYLDLSPVSAVCSAGEGWVDWHAGQGFGVGEPMALDCDHESEDGPRTHEISAPAPVFLDSPSKKHRRTSWSTGPLMLGDIVVARPSGPRYAVRRWTRREASGDALASSFAFSTLNWYPDVALTPSQRRLSVMAAIAEARGEGVPESNGGWRSWIVRQGSSHHPAPAIKSKKEDLGTTAEEADE